MEHRGKCKASMPWFKFFPKDWLDGTRGLTPEQRGVYADCIAILYQTEQPIPLCDKRASYRLEISARLWKSVKQALLAAGKLKETPDGYVNERVLSELDSRATQSRLKSESAANRERAKREKHKNENENKGAKALPCQRKPLDIRIQNKDTESEEKKENLETPVPNNSAAKPKRGTRLADDWVLPPDWENWALVNCPVSTPEGVRLEGQKFANYWQARSGREACKVDWFKTWKNRCLDVFGTAPVRNRPAAYAPQQSHLTKLLAKRRLEAEAVQ